MSDVGHGDKRNRGLTDYVRLGVEFLGVALLAWVGFTLQSMHQGQVKLDSAVTELQIMTTRSESKIDGLNERMDRLERIQDQDQ